MLNHVHTIWNKVHTKGAAAFVCAAGGRPLFLQKGIWEAFWTLLVASVLHVRAPVPSKMLFEVPIGFFEPLWLILGFTECSGQGLYGNRRNDCLW